MVSVLAAFHADVSVITRISTNELHCLHPTHRAEIEAMRYQVQTMIKQAVADGVNVGLFNSTDLDMTTFAILSMTIGISRWFSTEGRLTAKEIGAYYAAIALKLVHKEPETIEQQILQ